MPALPALTLNTLASHYNRRKKKERVKEKEKTKMFVQTLFNTFKKSYQIWHIWHKLSLTSYHTQVRKHFTYPYCTDKTQN